MPYNYRKLLGRITEKCGTQAKFAQAMGISERSISMKLNHKVCWKQEEITRAATLLDIPTDEIAIYFFTMEVQDVEQ